jgi:hypothetical protein
VHQEPDVTVHVIAQGRTKAAIEATRTSLLAAWRRDLDALRAEFDARLGALQPDFGHADLASPIERLAEELCGAAARDAEEAATRARSDALRAADERLARAEALARSELQQARADHADLQSRIEAAEAAHAHTRDALAASEARIANEVRERAAVAAAFEVARQAANAARARADASHAEIASLRQTIETLQEQMRAAAAAQADSRAAQQQLQQALVASEEQRHMLRADLSEATRRLEDLQQRAIPRPDAASLVRLRRSLQAFSGLADARDVVATFIRELAQSFDRVALFVVRENRLEGWQSIGLEPTLDVSNLVIPLTVDSPLTRAASARTAVAVANSTADATPGLLGHESCGAIAVPISIEQRLVVAYAELGRRGEPDSPRCALQTAEILAEYVLQTLTHIGSVPSAAIAVSAEPEREKDDGASTPADQSTPGGTTYPGPVRAADRVRMPEMVEVVVDGVPAQLIDLSRLGAQITCVKTIRPNQHVRLVLAHEGRNTVCSGQVVWALFEMAGDGGRYRAGLKFTKVDADAIEGFLSQYLTIRQRSSA